MESANSPEVGNVAVIGAGSWGTALAVHASRRAGRVVLWSRRDEDAQAMRRDRVNPRYLRDVTLPPDMAFTADLGEAVSGASLIIVAVPSHAMREVLVAVAAALGLTRKLGTLPRTCSSPARGSRSTPWRR